jgi:branched-chain amino acid transport system permease protein
VKLLSKSPRLLIIAGLTAVSILWPLLGASQTLLYSLTQVAIAVIFTSGVAFVIGHGGVATFGNQVFFGAAAYGVAEVTTRSSISNILVLLILGLFIGAALGFLMGLILKRVGGLAFGMVTLALGQISYIYVSQSSTLGGTLGIAGIAPGTLFGLSLVSVEAQFILAWVVMVLVILAIAVVRRSRAGQVLVAARDSSSRASAVGVRVYRYRLAALVLGAGICGLAGVLSATSVETVDPSLFYWTSGAIPVLAGLIGGMATLAGPIAGALLIEYITIWVSGMTDSWLLIEGVLALGLYLMWPEGVLGDPDRLQELCRGRWRTGRIRRNRIPEGSEGTTSSRAREVV